jgi:penicillin-binding protein 2
VSSNVYFFEIGGGFGSQKGLGITRIEKYVRAFGFGSSTELSLAPEPDGTIPNPAWKAALFNDEWRLGDTYNTAIGQYGFQVTPLQVASAVAALANGGYVPRPSLITTDPVERRNVGVSVGTLALVREGMRLAVTEGTASGLNVPGISVAAKTGTAELGVRKEFVNSWIVGFFPYEKPKYAFAVIMEHGPRKNLLGGVSVMNPLLYWIVKERPEYAKSEQ